MMTKELVASAGWQAGFEHAELHKFSDDTIDFLLKLLASRNCELIGEWLDIYDRSLTANRSDVGSGADMAAFYERRGC
jgi:hypothetical protein